MLKYLLSVICTAVMLNGFAGQTLHTKVLVVGGTTGGTAAAIQYARQGIPTIVVEQTHMLGGMLTAAAVSCTDGNALLHSGMWQQLRNALYKHYGTQNLEAGWVSETCFEPHVADSIFKAWAAAEKQLSVYYGWYFDRALKQGNKVTGAAFVNEMGETLTVYADIVIDATELGDVFASAGAGYDLGMEAPEYSKEAEAIKKVNIIQDLTWAAVLKDYGPGADKTIAKPAGYDEKKYYCSTSDAPCFAKPYALNTRQVLNYGKLTTTDTLHPKYMLNWPIHGNDYYLNVAALKPIDRINAYNDAKNQTLGFIYFLQTKLGYKNIGLADDEVNNGMAYIPYNREGRRLKGFTRFNINHVKNMYGYTLYRTGIAVGDYPVDHHHNQYPGKVPAIAFPKIPAFNIPLGALIPKNIDGLIVCEKGISVSNIANGTTRLQPVVLLTGQAAGIAAAKCVTSNIQPKQIDVRRVQDALLANKCYLFPYCDIQPDDPAWEAVQKISVMGIIHGVGKSEGWENKMFFYPDSIVSKKELLQGLYSFLGPYKTRLNNTTGKLLTVQEAWLLITDAQYLFLKKTGIDDKPASPDVDLTTWQDAFAKAGIKESNSNTDGNNWITRKQVAAMCNHIFMKPFYQHYDLDGKVSFSKTPKD
jgi:hypothetical protein